MEKKWEKYSIIDTKCRILRDKSRTSTHRHLLRRSRREWWAGSTTWPVPRHQDDVPTPVLYTAGQGCNSGSRCIHPEWHWHKSSPRPKTARWHQSQWTKQREQSQARLNYAESCRTKMEHQSFSKLHLNLFPTRTISYYRFYSFFFSFISWKSVAVLVSAL